MKVTNSRGIILRTVTVDFCGGLISLQGWRDPYINNWRGIVDYAVKWDAVLILRNFALGEHNGR